MKCLNIKQRGAIIRSRVQWYNDGEKNTKYFLNLEKRHLKQKTRRFLHLSDNEVVNTDEEILKEAKSFYQKLYSSTVSSIDTKFSFPSETSKHWLNESKTSVDASWRRLNVGKVLNPCNQIKVQERMVYHRSSTKYSGRIYLSIF